MAAGASRKEGVMMAWHGCIIPGAQARTEASQTRTGQTANVTTEYQNGGLSKRWGWPAWKRERCDLTGAQAQAQAQATRRDGRRASSCLEKEEKSGVKLECSVAEPWSPLFFLSTSTFRRPLSAISPFSFVRGPASGVGGACGGTRPGGHQPRPFVPRGDRHGTFGGSMWWDSGGGGCQRHLMGGSWRLAVAAQCSAGT